MKPKTYVVTEWKFSKDASGSYFRETVATKEITANSKAAAANAYFGSERAVMSMSNRGSYTECRGGVRTATVEIVRCPPAPDSPHNPTLNPNPNESTQHEYSNKHNLRRPLPALNTRSFDLV